MSAKQSIARPIRIALLGRMPPPIGGITISFMQLVEELRCRDDVETIVIDISRPSNSVVSRVLSFLESLITVLLRVRKMDVLMLNVRIPYDLLYGLLLIPLLNLFGVKVVVRKCAGNFDVRYDSFPAPMKWLYDIFLFKHSALWLFQTQALVKRFSTKIRNTHWFPTHRRFCRLGSYDFKVVKPDCRCFVYVGQVREYKGIRELVEAAERLDVSTTVDVYGPIFDDLPASLFNGRRRVIYKGVLKHENVVSTMRQYDAFVLPTKATTEGYPGAILEAYAAGLPVITTTCGAIPEIVDEMSGILVEPGNVEALYQAMKTLSEDAELYIWLCKGVRERAGQFLAEFWADKFVGYCREIADNRSMRM